MGSRSSIVRSPRLGGENESKTINVETKVSGVLGSEGDSLTEGDSAEGDQRLADLILRR